MDGPKLNLSALKGMVSSKLTDKPKKGKSKSFFKKKGSKADSKDASKEAPKDAVIPKDAEVKNTKEVKPTNEEPKKPKEPKVQKETKAPKELKEPKAPKELKEHKIESKNVAKAPVDDVLRREAMALGASEEDLALLDGLNEEDSEADFEDASNDAALNNDVSNFMKGLGFLGEVDVVSDEEPEEEPEEEEDEIEEDDASELDDEDDDEIPEESEPEVFEDAEEDAVQEAVLEKKPKAEKVTTNLNSVNSAKLKIENRIDWYNIELEVTENPQKQDRFGLERLTERAQEIVEKENKTYLEEFASHNSQRKFLSQVLSDGTLNDKISALTLLVQEAPLHNMRAFDTLLAYCEKKSRTASLQAIDAIKDLFLNGLLPDRKLVSFAKQPLSSDMSDTKLAIYFFEDYLKKSYFKFVQVLEFLSHDPILHVRMNVVSHIFDLLKAKPEQEANLLRLGVNKLGDVENKVAAKTSYQILQLEQAHPAMKKIVTDAVTDMVLQKNHDYHSQYYTILTLNQTILTRKEPDLANSLVKTYFSLFEKILVESDPALQDKEEDKTLGKSERGRKNNRKLFKKGKKGGKSVKIEEKTEEEVVEERSSKMFSALLTGLNRSFPFADLPSEIYLKHLDTLYKITHSTNFNTSVQALLLVQHIITQQDLDKGRYYRTLYESLMDPRLVNSSKQGVYLNLLFKSLKSDIHNVSRVLAFVKRMLQVCAHWINVGAIAGMFFLLMELSKTHPQILELMEPSEGRPEQETKEGEVKKEDEIYDPRKRNPEFANAHNSCLWEIGQFTNHYHPSVSIYAESLLEGKAQPKPDLGLYTLAHFLDRFVYKNAKQKANIKGSSIMQPLGGAHTGSLLVRATNVKSREVPVNTMDWLSRKAEEVRPDEKFFHQYFTGNTRKIKNKKVQAKGADDEEPLDDEEVWDALVKLKPDVEGLSDEEGFSDLDEDDFSDMSGPEDDGEVEDEEFDEAGFDAPDFAGSDEEDEDSPDIFGANEDDEYDSDEMPKMLGDEEEEEEEEEAKPSKKRSQEEDGKKSKKAKLLGLPVFASVDDYSQYLESDEE